MWVDGVIAHETSMFGVDWDQRRDFCVGLVVFRASANLQCRCRIEIRRFEGAATLSSTPSSFSTSPVTFLLYTGPFFRAFIVTTFHDFARHILHFLSSFVSPCAPRIHPISLTLAAREAFLDSLRDHCHPHTPLHHTYLLPSEDPFP